MFSVSLNDKEIKTISTIYNVNGVLGAGIFVTYFTDILPQTLKDIYSNLSAAFIASSLIGCMVYVLTKNHLIPVGEEEEEDEYMGAFEGA